MLINLLNIFRYHNDVYTNSDFDPNDSLEGTSVDDNESDKEYLDTNGGGVEHPLIEFQRAEEVVVKVVKHLQVQFRDNN